MFLFHYNTATLIFQYLYVFLHKIHKQISTNIKTSLQAATVAVDSIRNISAGAYIGSDGLFDTATLAAYKQQLEGLTVTQQKMALMTTNLTAAQREQVLSHIASTTATKTLTAEQVLSCTADEKRILVKAGLIAEEELEKGAVINLTQEKLKEILADETLNATEKNTILTKFGVTGANLTEASSWEVLGKSIGKATIAMMKWLFLTPAGWATLAIGGVVGLIGAYAKWGPTLENTREKLEDLKSECETLASDLSSVNSELETTKQRINELEGKESLTFVEAEELENLKKQNNELERTIDLLELEQKTKNKEKNKTFVDTMEKDVYSTDYYKDGLDGGKIKKGQAGRSEHRTTSTEQAYIIQQFNDREKLLDDLTNAETEAERKRIQEQIDKIDKYLSDRNDQFKSDAEGIDYIQNPTTEDDKKVNEWLDYINDFQDKMAIAMGGDNAKENAFNRLVDNWKFDELLNPLQQLGKEGKVTAEMLNDPKYDEFIQNLIDIGFISDDTEGSLRFVANAFNGVGGSASLSAAKTGEAIGAIIADLDNEAKACGTTNEEFGKLIGQHVLFGNTSLKTQDKIIAIKALEAALGDCSDEMKYLLQLFNTAAGNFSFKVGGAYGRTPQEAGMAQSSAELELARMFGTFNKVDIPEKESPYTPSTKSDKGSSKDNTPDYEDPTDAIINRINLRSKEIEQQEEYIQNSIEIAKIMGQEEHLISLTNDLIATRKKRVDELNTANAGLHNEAEYLRNSNKYDEESWFDSQGNATEAYYKTFNSAKTKEEQEKIKDLFESLSKYKKAYAENAEEIVNLNKQILQDEKNIIELRFNNSSNWISERNRLGDWELFNDNEVAAWERVIKWLNEDYPNAIDEIKEAEENLFEARKDAMEKSLDDMQDYIDARNHYNDWDTWGDNEITAIKRIMDATERYYQQGLLSLEEYNDRIDDLNQNLYSVSKDFVISKIEKAISDYAEVKNKEKEAIQEILEDYEDDKDDEREFLDFESSKYNSQHTLLQAYYDVINAISEAQHEIDKELRASMSMYEYLDEETRKLLFNEDNYAALSSNLNSILYEANALSEEYNNAILNATKENLEEITSQYQMQYDTMMKKYEIAKAELDVAKKRQKLDNVLKEKNVRMRINGKWEYVADTQAVIDAQNELADAEYKRQQEDASLRQVKSLNDLTEQQDKITTQINYLESDIRKTREAWNKQQELIDEEIDSIQNSWDEIQREIEDGSLSISDVLNGLATGDFPELKTAITGTGTTISSFAKSVSDAISAINDAVRRAQSSNYPSSGSSSSSSSSSSGGFQRPGANNATATLPNGNTVPVHIDSNGKTQTNLPTGSVIHTAGGDYKITGGTAGNYKSEPVTKKHADGTRYTPGGLSELGEKGFEAFIDNNGHLIPISQPTIGNIGAGGIVFNQEQMSNLRSLWDLSNLNRIPTVNIPNIASRQTGETNMYQLYGDMVFDGNNPEEIFKKMADFFKNSRFKNG